jgi:PKD repeat protein
VRVLALGLALVTMLAVHAAQAGASVSTVNGVQFGIEPVHSGFSAGPSEASLGYQGGPVVHSDSIYAVYWDPPLTYPRSAQLEINGFLRGFASEAGDLTNGFAAITQYGDSTAKVSGQSTFSGAYTDVDPYPATNNCSEEGNPCITDAQIRAELTSFISSNGLPSGLNPRAGATPIYLVLLPPGVTVCTTGAGEGVHCSDAAASQRLCSYHSYIPENPSAGLGTILYATQPWTPITGCQDGTGTLEEPNDQSADVIVNGVASEQLDTITDPLLTGWHDTGANTDEVTDKCRDDFQTVNTTLGSGKEYDEVIGGVPYYLNDAFSQAGLFDPVAPGGCISEAPLEVDFTYPTAVTTEVPVTFNASESLATLGIADYRWSFGDGTSSEVNCGSNTPTGGFSPLECDGASGLAATNSIASVVHRYTRPGTYKVKLTITDDGGHVASATEEVTVTGNAAASTSDTSSTVGKAAAKPVVGATILSRWLPNVLRSGLEVRYSVNERVAGYFQVLLSRALADRLGVTGPPAQGLPSGSPAAKVIATALLVTTKGGGSVLHIRLSSRTGARLRRVGRLPVTLRLIAHNASSAPISATVLAKATLTG